MPAAETAGDGPIPHPSRQTLARALSGTAEADEIRLSVLTHLIACCGECRRVVEELAELAHEYGHWDIAEAITEWREAPRLWGRLAALPPEEQLAAVEADDDYWTWGMCRLLQLRSAEAAAGRPPRPETAAQLAALALRIAGNLGESYDLTWVRGLRALCLACLGNAHRLLGELHAAGDALATARHLLDAGVGNVAFEAEVLLVAGLVARDRGRLARALGHLGAARALLAPPDAALADPGLLAAVLAQQAWCRHHLGEPAAAAVLLGEAAAFAGWAAPEEEGAAAVATTATGTPAAPAAGGVDPGLRWEIGLGQVWCALAAGDVEGAQAALGRLEGDGDGAGEGEAEATAAARLLRPAAHLAAAAGERGRAQRVLLRAIGELARQGEGVEAVLALLDLGVLLVEAEAGPELSALAAHVIPELLALGPRDLQAADFAALLAFQHACLAQDRGGGAVSEGGDPAAPVPAPAVPAAPRLTPESLHGVVRAIERRRRPALTWWSAQPPLFDQDEEESHAPAGLP